VGLCQIAIKSIEKLELEYPFKAKCIGFHISLQKKAPPKQSLRISITGSSYENYNHPQLP
jgi:hypothetical protein